jgi:hypothetical protein
MGGTTVRRQATIPLVFAAVLFFTVAAANSFSFAANQTVASRDGDPAFAGTKNALAAALKAASAQAQNPLWTIELKKLVQTRERPLFTSSRRPPAPAIVRAPSTPRILPKPAAPERPHLTLVGTIVGDLERFGLFVDSVTKAVIRLKAGSEYQGWLLRSVHEREVILEKNNSSTTLSLPAHESKGSLRYLAHTDQLNGVAIKN